MSELSQDATILEKEISKLIDAFELKHKNHQVIVETRVTDCDRHYLIKKGGSAQIKVLETSKDPEHHEPVTHTDIWCVQDGRKFTHAI
jgi:hypothetical protein